MEISLGHRRIGAGAPIFIMAEAGSSHNGDLNRAFRLIDAAVRAGADGVKFQVIIADEIVHPLTGDIELPGGRIPIYRRFKELERGYEFYAQIKEYTEKQGPVFLCSAFGIESARLLHSLNIQAIKIASPELNHYPLLEEVSGYDVPVILSTGVSTLGDIERALNITRERSILLHCVTSYPAPAEEYNLKLIPNLKAIFGRPVGVSDHSRDSIMVPALSALMGACLVEKHITLSSGGPGLDDPIALDPHSFTSMVKGIRRVEQMDSSSGLKWCEKEFGRERTKRILGDGVKRLAPSEKSFYASTNRSLHAESRIKAGEIISPDRVCIIRSEKNLHPGLGPEYLKVITGKIARRTIPAGEGIGWEDLL